ncbi:uncharacterized protein PADG_12211 [Paracoccidioides brasiliensis Pb18]|uniref:Uncharacterized protein n=2 Tax=Paracoccidioides brasiliensis TaxID=121759 RepID=A0A0A0HUF0_PARBD|nr:uncharacterized protein PADG_12211 [Paracoccidioides brasiliensis Pb18]KGM91641.1 hypothetical protein PADG_12211 [Paracoccidioides brasiliensis Pb18]ODH40443.1 hypothetical protein ACO22_01621 [Paracoccidioides brasiliensis]
MPSKNKGHKLANPPANAMTPAISLMLFILYHAELPKHTMEVRAAIPMSIGSVREPWEVFDQP